MPGTYGALSITDVAETMREGSVLRCKKFESINTVHHPLEADWFHEFPGPV
ncbi:hypothetical protein TSMEX_002006 [Taenia solium]|eukprot:TsM_000399700 transcript=TsM_000399700 gene=TsM_000399700